METESSNQQRKQQFFDHKTLVMSLYVVIGTLIYSIGVVWCLNLGEFFAGGVTGISQLLSHAIFGGITPYRCSSINFIRLGLIEDKNSSGVVLLFIGRTGRVYCGTKDSSRFI
jgi:hypothetical protein